MTPAQLLARLDRLARATEPAMRVAFQRSLRLVRDAIQTPAVEAALERGNLTAAMEAVPWGEIAEPELRHAWEPALRHLFSQAADATAQAMPATVASVLTVDDTRAAAWAQRQAGRLITEVTDETKAGVGAIVSRIFAAEPETKLTPAQAATAVKALVGLTERQVEAVQRLRADLTADGFTEARVDTEAAKYTRTLHDYRANLIARTETIGAVAGGQQDTWEQAVAEGVVTHAEVRRTWNTAHDDRLCPLCAPMDGQVRGLTETFEAGDGRPIMVPTVHPACRCGISTEVVDVPGEAPPAALAVPA